MVVIGPSPFAYPSRNDGYAETIHAGERTDLEN
jgi:hypothetical protein